MELETQVQVSGNQLRRQDQDIKQLREDLEQAATREKEQAAKFREQQHRYTDLESKVCFLLPRNSLITELGQDWHWYLNIIFERHINDQGQIIQHLLKLA